MPPYTKQVHSWSTHCAQRSTTQQHVAALAPPCPPETVFEEMFIPLEHGEMLHLAEPQRTTGTSGFEALLTPGRRLRSTVPDSCAAPHSRAVSDTATVMPAPFRCGRLLALPPQTHRGCRAGRRTVSTPGEVIDAACVELARSGTFTCETSELLSSMAAEEVAAS